MTTAYGQAGSYFTAMDPPGGRPKDLPYWVNAYLGAATSVEPGKAMKDLLNLPASGIENVELSVINLDKFEAIPKEMFSEARRLGKLLIRDFVKEGKPSPISMHAPIVEPTGFSENRWDENSWKSAQEQLAAVVNKAALLGPKVPVTIHGSHVPSMQTKYDPVAAKIYHKEIEKYAHLTGTEPPKETLELLQKGEVPEMLVAVDTQTYQLVPLRAEVRKLPVEHFWSPQQALEEANRTRLLHIKQQLASYQAELMRLPPTISPEIRETFERSLISSAATAFEYAAKADPNIMKIPDVQNAIKRNDYVGAIFAIPEDKAPMLVQPVEEFARQKAAETFANVAMRSFDIATNPEKVLGKEQAKEIRAAGITSVDKAPVITIENVSPEGAFGRGESMRKLVESARSEFAKKLVTERHLPEAKAKEIAQKLIGATWDVGHINLLRRYGYSEEKIVQELKKIAPDVKHVHITDNFGYYDAHLAPGMGNVPVKEFLKILEKEGKLKDVRGIVEAGGYVMHYGENPTPHTLRYFNVPTYAFQGAPTWGGEPPILGGYFMGSSGYAAGYGQILPPIHYSEYGAGFAGLPPALGAVPGAAQKSAFSGTPTA